MDEAKYFGRQLASALGERSKKKSTTSGAKTHPAVKRVMDAMSKWDHLEPSSHQVVAPKRSFSQASLPVTEAAQSASSSKAEASSSIAK